MATEDQKYFVSVEVKWGKQDANGNQVAESVGGQNWGALSYDQSVAVQNFIVIPGMKTILDQAGILGIESIELMGGTVPDKAKEKMGYK